MPDKKELRDPLDVDLSNHSLEHAHPDDVEEMARRIKKAQETQARTDEFELYEARLAAGKKARKSLKKPSMTDEELKENLLAIFGNDLEMSGGEPINPDGEYAWNRIEELKLELSDAIEQRDELEKDTHYLLDKTEKQRARIKELEAKVEEQAKAMKGTDDED